MPVVRSLSLVSPSALLAALLAAVPCFGQTATPPPGPLTNTSVVDADGTAHITRVVPLPSVLSDEAKKAYAKPGTDAASMDPDVVRRRAATQAWQDGAGKQSLAVYPVKITETKIAGVPVHDVEPLPEASVGPITGPGVTAQGFINDPLHFSALTRENLAGSRIRPNAPPIHTDRVLLCVHGGGFNSDSGSYSESIPIANMTRTRVVSVLYRLSPENQFPVALEDAIAVYKELLKTYAPTHIAIYGTSAGAILTGEIAAQLKHLGLPEPAALGVFSGIGGFAATGDSGALFTLTGFTGPLPTPPAPTAASKDSSAGAQSGPHPHPPSEYFGTHDPTDPILSPIRGDLHGLPPTLFITSSRDFLFSGTTDMERAWRRDGVSTQMTMFDGLPHAFWLNLDLPESREAYAIMAEFFNRQLGHDAPER